MLGFLDLFGKFGCNLLISSSRLCIWIFLIGTGGILYVAVCFNSIHYTSFNILIFKPKKGRIISKHYTPEKQPIFRVYFYVQMRLPWRLGSFPFGQALTPPKTEVRWSRNDGWLRVDGLSTSPSLLKEMVHLKNDDWKTSWVKNLLLF